MEKCLDSGAIQAFLDGELSFEQTEIVAGHIGACDACAREVAAAEEETALTFAALEQEFNTLVPTQRLWAKINDSIETEKSEKSFWTPIFAFFKQPSIAAFAALIIVAGIFVILMNRGNVEKNQTTAAVGQNTKIAAPTTAKSIETEIQAAPSNDEPKFVAAANVKNYRAANRVVAANVKREIRQPKIKKSAAEIENNTPSPLPLNETLTGEDSYIKTIATLTETVNNRKDEVLKASARFAFERDLAIADSAITTMKAEVKQNPQDVAAKQILRASYQNKIDLLTSVADKTELMASLK